MRGAAVNRYLATGLWLLCAAALMPSPAKGAYDPVAGGSARISFAGKFLKTLREHGVTIEAKGGKSRKGRVVLPAAGGEVDPKAGSGAVESGGVVVFDAGRRKVIMRDVVFMAKRAPLYAKVGGGQLKLATGARLTTRRSGFGSEFDAAGMELTSKFATRLNKKLRLDGALAGGQWLGTIHVEAQPATVHLKQAGRLYLTLDPAFAAKLNGRFVSVNPVAPAELAPGPTLSFPVGAESVLAPDAASGTVKLGGSAELLQLGSAQMFWRELWLEPAASTLSLETDVQPAPPHAGVAPQSPLLTVPQGGAVRSDPVSRIISISGSPVVLTGPAAQLLNQAFCDGEAVFAEADVVGSISLSANAE